MINKTPGVNKVQGQSEAAMQTGRCDQKHLGVFVQHINPFLEDGITSKQYSEVL